MEQVSSRVLGPGEIAYCGMSRYDGVNKQLHPACHLAGTLDAGSCTLHVALAQAMRTQTTFCLCAHRGSYPDANNKQDDIAVRRCISHPVLWHQRACQLNIVAT